MTLQVSAAVISRNKRRLPVPARSVAARLLCFCLVVFCVTAAVRADNGRPVIDEAIVGTLEQLRQHIGGTQRVFHSATGVLVFPDVVKMGFGIGSQYGEGALLVDNRPVAYYAIVGGSFGLSLGVHYKAQVVAFMTQEALAQFTNARAWEVGRDGQVALLRSGTEGAIDPASIQDPVVGIVFSERGLSYNVSLRGNRFVRIAR